MKAYEKNKNDKMKSMGEEKKYISRDMKKKKELRAGTSIAVRVHTSLVTEWSCNRRKEAKKI
jgi:hypothetical protein